MALVVMELDESDADDVSHGNTQALRVVPCPSDGHCANAVRTLCSSATISEARRDFAGLLLRRQCTVSAVLVGRLTFPSLLKSFFVCFTSLSLRCLLISQRGVGAVVPRKPQSFVQFCESGQRCAL